MPGAGGQRIRADHRKCWSGQWRGQPSVTRCVCHNRKRHGQKSLGCPSLHPAAASRTPTLAHITHTYDPLPCSLQLGEDPCPSPARHVLAFTRGSPCCRLISTQEVLGTESRPARGPGACSLCPD